MWSFRFAIFVFTVFYLTGVTANLDKEDLQRAYDLVVDADVVTYSTSYWTSTGTPVSETELYTKTYATGVTGTHEYTVYTSDEVIFVFPTSTSAEPMSPVLSTSVPTSSTTTAILSTTSVSVLPPTISTTTYSSTNSVGVPTSTSSTLTRSIFSTITTSKTISSVISTSVLSSTTLSTTVVTSSVTHPSSISSTTSGNSRFSISASSITTTVVSSLALSSAATSATSTALVSSSLTSSVFPSQNSFESSRRGTSSAQINNPSSSTISQVLSSSVTEITTSCSSSNALTSVHPTTTVVGLTSVFSTQSSVDITYKSISRTTITPTFPVSIFVPLSTDSSIISVSSIPKSVVTVVTSLSSSAPSLCLPGSKECLVSSTLISSSLSSSTPVELIGSITATTSSATLSAPNDFSHTTITTLFDKTFSRDASQAFSVIHTATTSKVPDSEAFRPTTTLDSSVTIDISSSLSTHQSGTGSSIPLASRSPFSVVPPTPLIPAESSSGPIQSPPIAIENLASSLTPQFLVFTFILTILL